MSRRPPIECKTGSPSHWYREGYADGREIGREGARSEAKRAEASAYGRGLRRGMAVARWGGSSDAHPADKPVVDWESAERQMEREIEEAKR